MSALDWVLLFLKLSTIHDIKFVFVWCVFFRHSSVPEEKNLYKSGKRVITSAAYYDMMLDFVF